MKLSTRWQCPTATLRPNKHPHGQSMCYWLLNIEGQDRLGQPWPIWCLAIGPCSKQLHWNWVLRVGFHVNCLRNCHSHNDPCPHHHTYAPSWDIGNEDEQLQRQPQRWWRKNISANNRDSAFDAGTYSQPPLPNNDCQQKCWGWCFEAAEILCRSLSYCFFLRCH